MSKGHDVIVIGFGAMGAAVTYELARRGSDVLALERFEVPNELGSAHGGTRIFRLSYYEHPEYVPLLQRAELRWRELEFEAATTLLEQTGGLWIGRPESELIGGTIATAHAHSLEYELLVAAAIADRFPPFRVPDELVGFHEPGAGVLFPERIVRTYADLARAHGATIQTNRQVTGLEATKRGVVVHAEDESHEADHVVLCAGAWTGTLAPQLAEFLQPSRQTVAWVQPPHPETFAPERFPAWAYEAPTGGFFYGFPMFAPADGFKISIHAVGESVDPETIDRAAGDGEFAAHLDLLRQHVPEAVGPIIRRSVCMYTNTPDGHFIIDRHPNPPLSERVTVACGFSGHGFKFVPVVGEAVADLVLGGGTKLPIGFLGLSRFQSG